MRNYEMKFDFSRWKKCSSQHLWLCHNFGKNSVNFDGNSSKNYAELSKICDGNSLSDLQAPADMHIMP